MRAAHVWLVLAALSAASAARKGLPSILRKCPSAVQEELNKCVLDQAKEVLPKVIGGLPQLKIPPLDPFIVERLSISNNGFDMEFTDVQILNMRHINFTDVKLDIKNGRLDLKGYLPVGALKAKYKSTGRLLGLAFRGGGDCDIKFYDMMVHYFMRFKRMKNSKDGIDDIVIYVSGYTFEPSRAEFWFENLLSGDETIARATNTVLNDNWRDVFEETKDGIFQMMDQLVTTEVRQFFKDVPYDNAFPELA